MAYGRFTGNNWFDDEFDLGGNDGWNPFDGQPNGVQIGVDSDTMLTILELAQQQLKTIMLIAHKDPDIQIKAIKLMKTIREFIGSIEKNRPR